MIKLFHLINFEIWKAFNNILHDFHVAIIRNLFAICQTRVLNMNDQS